MKLVLLTDITYPCDHLPFPAEVFHTRMNERGYDLVWVMRSSEDIAGVKETTWDGDPVYLLPASETDPKKTFVDYVLGRLESHSVYDIVRSIDEVDGIYVRNDLAMGLLAATLAAEFSIPYLHRISHLKAESTRYRATSEIAEDRMKNYIRGTLGKLLRRHVCNQADHVLPISHSMQAYLTEQGYQSRQTVITTGVNCRRQSPQNTDRFRSKFDIGPDEPLVLYLGTLAPERRPDFMIDVLQNVDVTPRPKLLVLGGRDQERVQSLQSYAEDAGVGDRMLFTGWIRDQDLLDQGVATADIALSPLPPDVVSFYHSSPVKVNEYLYQETPVVATRIPDHEITVAESGGGYCVAYDPQSFSRAIETLLTDGQRRAEMGRKGREFIVQHRCYDTLAAQLDSVFQQVCA